MTARTSWLDPHSPPAALGRLASGEPAPKPLWLRIAPAVAVAMAAALLVAVVTGEAWPLFAVCVVFVVLHEIGDE